jgi:hypothetical protein
MAKVNSYQNDVSITTGDKLTGSNEEGNFRQYPIGDLLSYFQANLNFAEGTDGIQSIVAGTGVSVDNTDPLNPIVTCTVTGGSTQSLQDVLDIGNSSTTDAEFLSGAKVLLTDQASYTPILGSQFEMNIVDTTSGNLYPSLKYIRKSNGTGSESSIADYNYMENNGTVDSGFTRAVWNHTRDTNTGVPSQLIGADNLVQFRNSNTSGTGSVELITANENTAALQDYGFNGTIQNVLGSRSQVQVDVPDATILNAYVLMSELDLSNGSTINNWVGLTVDVTQTVGQGTILGGAFIELALGIDETMAAANGIKAIDSKINLPSFFQGEVELANGLKFNADNTIKINGDELIEVAGDTGVLLSSSDGLSLAVIDVFEFKGSSGISIYNQPGFQAYLNVSNLTADRELIIPNAGGTIALTSDITALDGYSETGTIAGGDLIVKIGDHSDSYTSTKLTIDIDNEQTIVTGEFISNSVSVGTSAIGGTLLANNLTVGRFFELPDANGNLALTSDVSLQNALDNGNSWTDGDQTYDFDISSGSGILSYRNTDEDWGWSISAEEQALFFTNGAGLSVGRSGIFGNSILIGNGNHVGSLQSTNLTQARTFELPDASGTVALTSDITASELLAVDSTQTADFDVTDAMTSGMVKVDSATDITVTVRDFATHPIPVGSVIAIMQANTGTITVNYTGSATGDALKTFRDGDVLSLWHEEEDRWVVINPPHAIDSTTVNEPAGSDQVLNIVTLTQAEYDAAVGSYNAETLYIITS